MKSLLIAKIGQSPQTPGVYLMKDGDGSVIYVGKSINIRKRLLQHAASLNTERADRYPRWINHVSDVSWHETGSELYALLIEDQWIKKYWPAGNVRQKDFLEYAYLAVTEEAIPRLLAVDGRQRRHYRHLFGPFRDIYRAEDLAESVRARYRLRTCATVSDAGCLQSEIRKCSAPCRSPEAAVRYRRTTERTIASLLSFDPSFIRYLHHRIRNHVQKKEFEMAARYHSLLGRYPAFIKQQKFVELFRQHGLIIRENGRWPNTFQFLHGRLIGRNGNPVSEPCFDEVDGKLIDDEWRMIDRAHVIHQWLRRRREQGALAVVDGRFFADWLS